MNKIILKQMIAVVALGLGMGSSLYAGTLDRAQEGTLQVTVLDANGKVVENAPVYIYGEHKTHFVGGKDIPGSATLDMPAGEYKISSALIRKTGDYIDRFASHEAHVRVIPGDNVSVILTLTELQDPTPALTYSALRHMGAETDLATNF